MTLASVQLLHAGVTRFFLIYNAHDTMRRHILAIAMAITTIAGAAGAHVMIDGKLQGSAIYPGTEHAYQVYVPEQYTGKQAACLYVGLDGVLCDAPRVLDSLIAAGKMPVTIGVFLQPGVVKNARGEVVRYNRSYEFDSPTAVFATFLDREVLPAIEGTVTPDGRVIKLSGRAQDRAIFGLSSGGIAAFTAAWHRPWQWGRVFSGVGTFVGMRGGNDLPKMVRKTEPKPIKVFLQDGTADAWNALFGHWYEGNRMLASALDFAGYDVKCDWSDCGHNVTRATQIFASVMTWLWQDWPAAIVAGTTRNDMLAALLVPGSNWEPGSIADGHAKPPRHMAVYPDGSLEAKAVLGSNCLLQWVVENGHVMHGEPFYWLESYGNAQLHTGGMAYDSKGNLWVVTDAGIQVCDHNGRVRGIVDLPVGLDGDVSNVDIAILPRAVRLTATGQAHEAACPTWTREFNVEPPVAGVRPPSQGQG